MWIFHRARTDGAVVLGWRHPWEHAEDPWASVTHKDDHIDDNEDLRAAWETHQQRAAVPGDGDDDDDDEEDVSFVGLILSLSMHQRGQKRTHPFIFFIQFNCI
jgi:hypothetical protein